MRNNISAVIADDNREFAMITEEYLTDNDIDVVGIASDGLDALEATLKKTPDILILDLIMPHIDGLEVIRKIRQDYSLNSVKILVLSTYSAKTFIEKAMQMGADFFMLKPVNLDDLVYVCKRIAAGKNDEIETEDVIDPYEETFMRVNEALKTGLKSHGYYSRISAYYYLFFNAICGIISNEAMYSLLQRIDGLMDDNIVDINIYTCIKEFKKLLYKHFEDVLGICETAGKKNKGDSTERKLKDITQSLLATEREDIENFTGYKFDVENTALNYLRLLYKMSEKVLSLTSQK